jgi:hypothetical protein
MDDAKIIGTKVDEELHREFLLHLNVRTPAEDSRDTDDIQGLVEAALTVALEGREDAPECEIVLAEEII